MRRSYFTLLFMSISPSLVLINCIYTAPRLWNLSLGFTSINFAQNFFHVKRSWKHNLRFILFSQLFTHTKSAQIVLQNPQKNTTRSLPTSFRTLVRRYYLDAGQPEVVQRGSPWYENFCFSFLGKFKKYIVAYNSVFYVISCRLVAMLLATQI